MPAKYINETVSLPFTCTQYSGNTPVNTNSRPRPYWKKYMDRSGGSSKRTKTNWRQPNDLLSQYWEMGPVKGNFTSSWDGGTAVIYKGEGTIGQVPWWSPDDYWPGTNLENRIKTQVLGKLKQQEINVSVAIAEARKTVSHLGNTALRVYKAYSAARRRDWKTLRKTLGVPPKFKQKQKSAAGGWLEYQYAWLPLLSDIYGGYTSLQRGIGSKELVFAARSKYRDTWTERRSSLFSNSLSDQERNWGGFTVYTGYSEIKCSAYYRMNLPLLAKATELGLTNPLTVAWELVPFSFVVDWFLPIGSVLDALDSDMGSQLVGASMTKAVGYTARTTLQGGKTGIWWNVGGGFGEGRYEKVSRHVLKDIWPNFYVKNPFSASHAISALALWRALKR